MLNWSQIEANRVCEQFPKLPHIIFRRMLGGVNGAIDRPAAT